MSRTA